MRIIFIITLLLSLCFSVSISYAEPFELFPFDPSLSQYIQSYHFNPDPSEALDRFFSIDMREFEEKAEEKGLPHSRAVLMAFYIHILHDNDEQVLPFAHRLSSVTQEEKAQFGLEAIAYGAKKNRREALAVLVESFRLPPESLGEYAALRSYPYPTMEADHWRTLDVLWVSYFATGDCRYIRKIAKSLTDFRVMDEEYKEQLRLFSEINPKPGSYEYRVLVGGLTAQASLFSLTVNAAQDPVVLAELREVAGNGNRRMNKLAKQIVQRVDEARGRMANK